MKKKQEERETRREERRAANNGGRNGKKGMIEVPDREDESERREGKFQRVLVLYTRVFTEAFLWRVIAYTCCKY